MRTQAEFDYLAESESHAPVYFGVQIDSSFFVTPRPFASNDASCDDQTSSANQIEGRARQASAANGFGDVATNVTAPASFELHQAARTHRTFVLGATILATIRAIGALLRRSYTRLRQRRAESALRDTLHRMDDRVLRDLGLHRSEIDSLTTGTTGSRHARTPSP